MVNKLASMTHKEETLMVRSNASRNFQTLFSTSHLNASQCICLQKKPQKNMDAAAASGCLHVWELHNQLQQLLYRLMALKTRQDELAPNT